MTPSSGVPRRLRSNAKLFQLEPEVLSKLPVNKLPVEILSTILREYIRDYFKVPRYLYERPPAPLHVCHRWRQTAINSPECWTLINIYLETSASAKYTRRGVTLRDTRIKASQDTLNNYFSWAKGAPIDLRIKCTNFLHRTSRANLVHWISSSIPKLWSY